MFVCSLGSCPQNKCQGKSEEKCFHPFIITSKKGCLTLTLLLAWGGESCCVPQSRCSQWGQAVGRPVSSCPSNVLGLKRSQVSLLLHPFSCITPAKPLSTTLGTCCGLGNWGAKERAWHF